MEVANYRNKNILIMGTGDLAAMLSFPKEDIQLYKYTRSRFQNFMDMLKKVNKKVTRFINNF